MFVFLPLISTQGITQSLVEFKKSFYLPMVQCFSSMGTILVDLFGVVFVSVALGVGRDKQEWLLMDLFFRRS